MSRSPYKPEFVAQAEKLCLLGATDVDIADFFGVASSTLYKWKHDYPEFAAAIKSGKEESDERVERSLYQNCVGYYYDTEKVFQFQGEVIRVPVKEYVPAHPVSQFFWLQNRRPDRWRNVQRVEHGKPGDFSNLNDDELDAIIKEHQASPSASNSREIKAQEQKAATRSRRLN